MTSNSEDVATIEDSVPALTITVAEKDAENKVDGGSQCNSSSNQDITQPEDGINTAGTISYPQVDFPFTFYNFINKLSVSHPHIVSWSECGKYFRIDRQAKELPSLIGQNFQRECFFKRIRNKSRISFLKLVVHLRPIYSKLFFLTSDFALSLIRKIRCINHYDVK